MNLSLRDVHVSVLFCQWMLLPAQWKCTKRIRTFLVIAPLGLCELPRAIAPRIHREKVCRVCCPLMRPLLAGMHVVMHFTLSVAWFQLIIVAPLLAMMPRCTGVTMTGV